ncbi:MAG: flippase-like domain-containing protein [Gammaproteobacteria bacterium]
MSYVKFSCLVLGVLLLALAVRDMDMVTVLNHVRDIGLLGMVFVLLFFAATFLMDVAGWQLTLLSVPLDLRWLWRLYLVRTAGEAINNVTPFGSMGGEPIKALMLKARYGVGYQDSSVSLILAKTLILMALVVFLALGFGLLLPAERLSDSYKAVAGLGLAGLATGIGLFFLMQRYRISSWVGRRLGARWPGFRWERAVRLVHELDERMAGFYTAHRGRMVGAFLFALLNWLMGVGEVYVVMYLLGHPVSFVDAWIMEALVQLVRAGTSFIPSSLGAQEGTFKVVCAALTGDPNLGLACAVVRRAREVIWIAAGIGLWWTFAGGEAEAEAPQDAALEAPRP